MYDRAEDIAIQNIGESRENAFPARIDRMEFLGSFYRVEIGAESIGDLRLQADLSINLVRSLGIAEGVEVLMALPRDHIRVYPGGLGRD